MKFKRLMALAMAGVMTFAMAGTAFADAAEPTLTKVIQVNDGVTIPADKELTFKVAPVSPSPYGSKVAAPETIDAWTVTQNATSASITDINLGITAKLTGKKQGEYVFKVTEEGTDDTGYGWKYNTENKEYYIRAFVPNAESASAIQFLAYTGTTDDAKADELKFTNIFTERAGSEDEENPDKASLTITKTIGTGKDYANLDDEFTFEVKFTAPTVVNGNEPTSYVGKIGDTTKVTATPGGDAVQFTIKANEVVSFADIPAGAKYTVTEVQNLIPAGYEYSSGAVEDDTNIPGTGASAAITNNYQDIPVTGLALNMAPFIAMFAAVGAVIALYVAAKRRVR